MRICFFDPSPNENAGSYRIWVKDLCGSMNDIGVKSRICSNISELQSAKEEVIIFSKSSYHMIDRFENKKNHLLGAINVAADCKIKGIDFVIVGSHEERISLSSYDHVFLYPLIERKFMNLPRRIHKNTENFKICYHGHYPHLFKFTPHLRDAIESVNNIQKVELHVVTSEKDLSSWWTRDKGKPSVEIIYHPYEEIEKAINNCDVGVVPNILDLAAFAGQKLKAPELGLYETDYFLRFKNKTNPGRAYVFYQFGLPVIHDMSPSSFEMMAYTGIYDLAHDKLSWSRSFKKYMCSDYRQKVSDTFKKVFEDRYDPKDWAKKLHENITRLKNE